MPKIFENFFSVGTLDVLPSPFHPTHCTPGGGRGYGPGGEGEVLKEKARHFLRTWLCIFCGPYKILCSLNKLREFSCSFLFHLLNYHIKIGSSDPFEFIIYISLEHAIQFHVRNSFSLVLISDEVKIMI